MKKIKKNAFTLIELLVVMAIIAILATIISNSFVNSQIRSRDSLRKSELKSLAGALEMYYADNGVFPETTVIQGLVNNGSEFADSSNPSNKIIYMKKVPSEERMEQILYETSSNKKAFRLYSNLENDEDGDCTSMSICNNLGYEISSGCCYMFTSSNIGVTETLN
jgi:type II secretion system protein G